jgi:branched-chain amino acid transport system permease protein
MNLQFLADGLLIGAMIGLGAIGVTLTYSILGFANFVHGEFIAWGAYGCLVIAGLLGFAVGSEVAPLGPFSVGWTVLLAGALAMALTGLLALALDWLLFARLRRHGNAIVLVMASFGASMALRSLLEFLFTAEPQYFSRELQIAMPIGLGVRVTPDQLLMLGLTAALVVAMHLLITRTTLGRAMRAVSENPALARVAGIDVAAVIRKTWLIGGALACAAGIVSGITVQIRPFMGFDLLLPMFSAAILGGIGSVPGAVIGGLIVGLAESCAVQFVGAEYRAAVAFLLLIAVLLVRPNGLFGKAAA